ncbi:MAG: beta-N-acetylhexosaminidase [Prevotellaceae bacterium]|jgi:hexosaminidase|nr:beta-N-acetylhexosaminidase [Prevotellaceae bacterium]
MKNILCFSLAVLCVGAMTQRATAGVSIIPQPTKCVVKTGEFVVNSQTKFVLSADNAELRNAVWTLNERFKTAAGFTLPVAVGKAGSNSISCAINPKIKGGDEAYTLAVTKSGIAIEARTPHGIFNATQTLRQLLPPQFEGSTVAANVTWTVPCVSVEDAPRFGYRGLHLDVARHFMSKEEVMRYIDLLAYHKLNVFHWHLTEDQGWRIEIKRYPKLTKVGAYRNRTLLGEFVRNPALRKWITYDQPYGGFYTQDDVREVLAYAEKHFVTVIPEIEMPGHAVAALAGYPELSCCGGPFEVIGIWGVLEDIFCAGRDTTFGFLENVLTEVCELFPSPYIHIGGDEAPKLRWTRCHACQERIKALGLKDEHELQSYFITRIEKFVATKGKRIIGWDEILEGGLAPNATVMSWRGEEGGIAAAKQKHDVIMTPNSHAYLDYGQVKNKDKKEPRSIGGYLPLSKVYSYDPIPASLTADEAKHILGFQGNVWSEYLTSFNEVKLEYGDLRSSVLYMAYPRAAAIAEVGWTGKAQKNYADFRTRLTQILLRYDAMGVGYNKTFLTEE